MVTLDRIVRDLLSQEGMNTTHNYLRYLRIANKGLKELTFDILGDTKVDLLEVSAALRIDLPTDYIDYTYVGIVGSDGYLHTLGSKRNIPGVGTTNVTAQDNIAYPYLDGLYGSGAIFGNGGGQNSNGYYSPQIDRTASPEQMILTSIAAGKFVYLEYISDGRATDDLTKIHPYAEEALTAYIYWKSIQRKRRVPNIEKSDARMDYYNEKRLARSRLVAFTKEEALQTVRKGFKQAPKV